MLKFLKENLKSKSYLASATTALIVILSGASPAFAKARFIAYSSTTSSINNPSKPWNSKPSNNGFLIAASPQLDNLLYNMTYRVTSIARYYKYKAQNFDQAYTFAWSEFYKIIDPNSLSDPIWTNSAGWIYAARLKGGGSASIREYGSSTPLMPTIDIQYHYTAPLGSQTFYQIREVKFPFYGNDYCPASTSSSC